MHAQHAHPSPKNLPKFPSNRYMQEVSGNNIATIFWQNALFNLVKIFFVRNCPHCPRIALSKNCPTPPYSIPAACLGTLAECSLVSAAPLWEYSIFGYQYSHRSGLEKPCFISFHVRLRNFSTAEGAQSLQNYKDAKELTSRWKVCFRQTSFLNEAHKVFYSLFSK